MVNGLYGPGLMDQAEAIAAAIVSAVNKLIAKPPAPSITSYREQGPPARVSNPCRTSWRPPVAGASALRA